VDPPQIEDPRRRGAAFQVRQIAHRMVGHLDPPAGRLRHVAARFCDEI
jgi:hypothetical protein